MTGARQPALFGSLPAEKVESGRKARRAGDRAVRRVEQHADPQWLAEALAALRSVAEKQALFTTDDVWDRLDLEGFGRIAEPRALGAVMRRAAKLGWVEPTDWTRPGRRKVAHGRPVRVWRSKLGGKP